MIDAPTPSSRSSRGLGEAKTAAPLGYGPQAATPCALCGGRWHDYLFVLGQTRMTRCHDCGLVSRSESAATLRSASYALDASSERALHKSVAGVEGTQASTSKRRVLQLTCGEDTAARLKSDRFLEVTDLSVGDDVGVVDTVTGTYDAVFVNGVADFVRDPVELLKRVRAHVVRGGSLVIVGASDLPRSDESLLPRHLYGPVQLLRLAMTAGWKPLSCGLLSRAPDDAVPDERLQRTLAFAPVYEALTRLGQKTDVPSGLLSLSATNEELPARPKLSIVMPVFNEAATFADTFRRVAAAKVEGVTREIIVIESNSTDGSRELVKAIEGTPDVRVIYEDRPRGKGHAVRAGLELATGDFILIQDADSEYDVADYDIVLAPLLQMRATFVLGSRHLGARTWKIRQFGDYKSLSTVMNLAHEGFTTLANVLYDTDMNDPTTMYKVFRRECYEGVDFKRDRFDFDFELVCKLIRRGHIPLEVPINYKSRSYSEGKKVRFFRDPLTWLSTIVSSRFERLEKE